MTDQVQDFDEEYSIVQIEDHPLHGMFEVEVPAGWDDDQVVEYVEGLDLDLMLGLPPEEQDKGELNVDKIKEWENSVGAGLRGGKWYSHASLEGGTDTIAYGHKLTDTEAESGFIDINGKAVDFRKGLTQEQAQDLLNQDAGWAKDVAVASLAKVGLTGDEGKVQALTSLIYNVGSGAWGQSKAKKFLEAGQMEDFMHEAFSEDVGFVKINGEKSRGLVRRRGAEAALFASANINEGSGFGDMMAETLNMINPISSAAAAEITPQEAEQQMALQQANETLGRLSGVGPGPRKPEQEPKFGIPPRKPEVPEAEQELNWDLPKLIGYGLLSKMGFDIELNESDFNPRTLAAQREALGGSSAVTSYKQFNEEVDKEDDRKYEMSKSQIDQLITTLVSLSSTPERLLAYMKDDKFTAAYTLGRIALDKDGKAIDERWNFNDENDLMGAASPFTAGRALLAPFMPGDGEGPKINVNLGIEDMSKE